VLDTPSPSALSCCSCGTCCGHLCRRSATGADASSALLLLIARSVLATTVAFAGALVGLLVLHLRQPLVLSEQQFVASTAVFQEDPAPPPSGLQNPPKSQLSWATAPEALIHATGVAPSCGRVLSQKTVSGTRLNSARESGNAPRQPRQERHPGPGGDGALALSPPPTNQGRTRLVNRKNRSFGKEERREINGME
jgi:hypothetical protein